MLVLLEVTAKTSAALKSTRPITQYVPVRRNIENIIIFASNALISFRGRARTEDNHISAAFSILFYIFLRSGRDLAGVQERVTNYAVRPLLLLRSVATIYCIYYYVPCSRSPPSLVVLTRPPPPTDDYMGLDKSPMRQIRYPHVRVTSSRRTTTTGRTVSKGWGWGEKKEMKEEAAIIVCRSFDKRIIWSRNRCLCTAPRIGRCVRSDGDYIIIIHYIILLCFRYSRRRLNNDNRTCSLLLLLLLSFHIFFEIIGERVVRLCAAYD